MKNMHKNIPKIKGCELELGAWLWFGWQHCSCTSALGFGFFWKLALGSVRFTAALGVCDRSCMGKGHGLANRKPTIYIGRVDCHGVSWPGILLKISLPFIRSLFFVLPVPHILTEVPDHSDFPHWPCMSQVHFFLFLPIFFWQTLLLCF